MKLTKKQALDLAKTAKEITMTDSSLGWSDRPISLEDMTSEIKTFGHGHWHATQHDGIIYIDILAGICFTVTL
jgi:hypothetical protein